MIPLPEEALRRLSNFPYPTNIAPTYLFISRAQYRVFSIAHYVAPLSIFGSLAIIYRIIKIDRHETEANGRGTYFRLLLAMSICDVLGSISLLFGATPLPRDTLLETARGNRATCATQGFFLHVFVLGVLYYNTGLMLYFVTTIRYGWTEAFTKKWLEPFVHVWALLVPFSQAVAGLFLGIFNPIGYGNFCHISPYPPLCGLFENACTRGLSARLLYTLFCTIPESVLLAIIYVSIALIYCTVRSQGRRALAVTANRETIRARTKAVAIQSLLFALIFFNTWIYTVLGPLLAYTVKQAPVLIKAEFILSVMTSTFLPLQGFFNFCVYIRPRFVRFWVDQQLPVCVALRLAVFGGQASNVGSFRRSSTLPRKRSSQGSTQSSQYSGPQGIAAENASPIHSPRICEGIAENEEEVRKPNDSPMLDIEGDELFQKPEDSPVFDIGSTENVVGSSQVLDEPPQVPYD